MKKMLSILGLIVLVTLIAGVTYAHWEETLYINGKIETGTLKVQYTYAEFVYEEAEGKEVAKVSCVLKDLDQDGNYDKVELNLTNVYPCFSGTLVVIIKNCGTIPVKIVDGGLEVVEEDPVGFHNFIEVTSFKVNGTEYWPDLSDLLGLQLEPGEILIVEITIHVIQEYDGETCPENAELLYEGYVTFIQWNMYGGG